MQAGISAISCMSRIIRIIYRQIEVSILLSNPMPLFVVAKMDLTLPQETLDLSREIIFFSNESSRAQMFVPGPTMGCPF